MRTVVNQFENMLNLGRRSARTAVSIVSIDDPTTADIIVAHINLRVADVDS